MFNYIPSGGIVNPFPPTKSSVAIENNIWLP